MKTFVIAGDHHQATQWIRQDISYHAQQYGEWRSMLDYIYVSSAERLKGYSNPHGRFVGTWRERKDLREILITLHVQSNPPNPAILPLLKEFT